MARGIGRILIWRRMTANGRIIEFTAVSLSIVENQYFAPSSLNRSIEYTLKSQQINWGTPEFSD